MTLLGYWLRKASSPLIFALGSVACTAATYALYSAGSLITGAAACPAGGVPGCACPAGGVVGCPWAGCVVLWPTAPTAIPSITVSRIFFISMAPWIFWGIALLGNVFLKLAATAFRLDHSASGSCFGMPGFHSGRAPGKGCSCWNALLRTRFPGWPDYKYLFFRRQATSQLSSYLLLRCA